MKYLITVCALICLILGAKLLIYIYRPEPYQSIKFNQSYTGYVIPIEQDLTRYHCLELNRLSGGKLKFCTLREKMDATSTPRVMGEFNRLTDTIRLDKDSPNDRILHETFHSCSTQPIEEELKAQCFQSFYLQLVDLGLLN